VLAVREPAVGNDTVPQLLTLLMTDNREYRIGKLKAVSLCHPRCKD